MKAEIISVGNELLTGTIVNTNTAFLARNLALMGFEVRHQTVVGDVEEEIIDAVRMATKRSHVTILTGGLGPTEDDLTKESVAKAFDLKLVHSPKVEKRIRKFFEQRGKEMPENNLKQAMVINGSEVLQNENGTAPGLYLQTTKQAIILLPGPPAEVEPMFENEVRPRITSMSQSHSVSASLHVFGLGESELEEKVKDLLYSENPTAALYAKSGEVHIDLVATAETERDARALLDLRIAALKDRVGDYIYSENGESMAQTVVRTLLKTKTEIAVAESCTGGLMAAGITDVEGASQIFHFGMAAYSDDVKQSSLDVSSSILRKYTSISSAAAAEMAKGAREKGGANIGVGITGVAGPKSDHVNKPVGLVYIAIADKKRVIVKKFNFGTMRSREALRNLSVLHAFDMVRRFVLGLDIEDARLFGDGDLADVERNGKPRKKSSLAVQKAVTTTLCAILAMGGLFLAYRAVRARLNQSVYNELRAVFLSGDVGGLAALRDRNPDTVGWLAVDGTPVDAVVVNGKDGDYYRNHDFSGSQNSLGCLYVDANIDMSSSPDNVVIYGNSGDPKQMFGPLLQYTDLAYLETNYLINFHTLYADDRYRIVSVFYANSNTAMGDVQSFYLQSTFEDANAFTEFVIQAKMRSLVNIEADVVTGDKFITLVTDAPEWEGAKLVVVARQVRDGEWTEMTSAMFTQNIAAVYPQKWYDIKGTQPSHNELLERDKWLNWILANEKNAGQQNGGSQSTSGGVSSKNNKKDGYITKNKQGEVCITVYMNGAEVTDTPTAIISRIVAYEMSNTYEDEAIKAQAVATLSWIRYSYATIGMPEVSGTTPSDRITQLVASVINEGVFYNGEFAFATYFESAPNTYSASDVWGLSLPYLASVESKGDSSAPNYKKEVILPKDQLKQRLETYFGIKLSDNIQNWIKITSTTTGGLVTGVSIDGKVDTTGIDLSEKCLLLKSPNFTVTFNDEGATFAVLGTGHGVGMSKTGANYYAKQGWTYQEILQHYYTGTTVDRFEWTV